MNIVNECHAYNTLEHEFKGIRVIDRHLTPVTWKLVVKVAGIDVLGDEAEIKQQRLMVTVAFQKLQWWLSNFLDEIFLASAEDSKSNASFFDGEFSNAFVSVPFMATDDVICEAINSKMSVLSDTYIHVLETSLKSDDFNSAYHFSSQAGYKLPMSNDIYEGMALHDKPWWARADCDTWEPMVIEGTEKEDLFDILETFSDVEEVTDEMTKMIMSLDGGGSGEIEETEAEVVGTGTWKPKKV